MEYHIRTTIGEICIYSIMTLTSKLHSPYMIGIKIIRSFGVVELGSFGSKRREATKRKEFTHDTGCVMHCYHSQCGYPVK